MHTWSHLPHGTLGKVLEFSKNEKNILKIDKCDKLQENFQKITKL